jgi:hypothetical protein
MRRRSVPLVIAIALLITPLALASLAGADRHELPQNDPRRGLVYDGLTRAPAGSRCQGGYEIASGDGGGPAGCTHGPDPSPAGVDVARSQPPATDEELLGATSTVCEEGDDGASGYRVQAIYAHPTSIASRYALFEASFGAWAGNVEAAVADSATRFGGERHVRWVHDGACNLDIDVVALTSTELSTIGNMRTALRNRGYDADNRKYLVWADTSVYCGVAYIWYDDQPGEQNMNNGAAEMYARIDNGCWGFPSSVEAHELMHNLGGVQKTAPHASANGHCLDDQDRMCYDDDGAGGKSVSVVCDDLALERLFDCNGDDYFHPSPASGSWLASHWNTYNSRFLFGTAGSGGGGGTPDPEPDPDPDPSVDITDTFSSSVTKKNRIRTHTGLTGAGSVILSLSTGSAGTAEAPGGRKGAPGPSGPVTWTVAFAAGPVVESTTSGSLTVIDVPAGSYTVTVSNSANSGSYTLTVTHPTP